MFVTNWNSTTKIQKISEITNFFRHYFLSRTEVRHQPHLRTKRILKPKYPGIHRCHPFESRGNQSAKLRLGGTDAPDHKRNSQFGKEIRAIDKKERQREIPWIKRKLNSD